ncbi:MAG: PDDEXK family nuclease [Mobilitalea sp.]
MKKLKNLLVVGNRSQSEACVISLLRFHFRKLNILPNDKSAIGKEIDIFLPDLKVALEIQGPTHQKIIYSEETFLRTLKNDEKKAILCEQANIKLIPIYLPEKSSDYYTFLKKEIREVVVPEILKWITLNNINIQ